MRFLAKPAVRWLMVLCLAACPVAVAQVQAASAPLPPQPPAPQTSGVDAPVLPLFRALRSVGLDSQAVYKVREAEIDREDVHISLEDGVIAFTQSVDGHITG